MINYFHDRHVVLHFSGTPELDRLVVLNAQWLIDICKMVITVTPLECQEEAFREHWQELERKGVLRIELVEHVWKDLIPEKETIVGLLHILERFGLVCQWTQSDGSKVCVNALASLFYVCLSITLPISLSCSIIIWYIALLYYLLPTSSVGTC